MPPCPSRLSLLVMSRMGVFTYPLPESGDVTVGRSDECHVSIEDAKVSRCHLRLQLDAGPIARVIDAGSANGTFIGGRRLEPNAPTGLALGEMVTVGTTVLVLQQIAAAGPARVYSKAAFEARVAEARARAASTGGSGYALLRIHLAPGALASARATTTRAQSMSEVTGAEALERALRETLGTADVVGGFTPGVHQVLLVAADAAHAVRTRSALDAALRAAGLDAQVEVMHHDEAKGAPLPIPVASRAVARVHEQASADDAPTIERIAASAINVLIRGETGVGKEVMARRLHQQSPRADAPLLCINCAALSESLLESELFGYEKGAFTGASQSKLGLLEAAQGGTVFLDEVGEMPAALQAKLLRVLEQREVLRVGALKPRPIDVRFVSATNRDLEADVEAGRFRRDLYFRLEGITVSIPPLRERVHEIEPLARAFVAEACAEARRARVPQIAPTALALLRRYAWPGNVRELRNVMERAVVLGTGDVIDIEHLPTARLVPVVELGQAPGGPEVEALAALYDADPDREQARILDALTRSRGNQTQAAARLGISRRTLINKLERYKLPRPRKKA